MKRSIAIITFLLLAISSFAQGLKFAETKHSFGMVREGEKLVHEYAFENTGTQAVTITDVKFECTCTTVDHPKEPIQPGQKGVIKITFDTLNKYDRQDRIVELFTTAQAEPYKLRFKCIVLKPKGKK